MSTAHASETFIPPGPYPGTTDLGFLRRTMRNMRSQIGILPRGAYEMDAWKPPIPGMPLFITSPELVKTVLLDQADDFPQGELFERIMRPAWGEGLLLAKGDNWRRQRRAAAQAFRANGMTAFVPTFMSETNKLLARWTSQGFGRVCLHEEMKRLTFNIIVETMLSGAMDIDREGFRESVQSFFADITELRTSYAFRNDAYHAKRPSRKSKHRAAIIEHLVALVETRRASPPRGDLVDLLLTAEDPETGASLSDNQLVDNLLGFILAGYETSSTALTWTLYLIAAHMPTEQRLLDEVRAKPAWGQDLTGLPFTRQVISEAMRLYPPAYMLTRVAARDCTLGKYRIKHNQRINIPIWAIHRHAQYWSNPHAFDPDRFAPDKPAPDRYTYMPFGAGPRICIGAAFAMTEMMTLLAILVPRLKITPPAREYVWPKTELALVPQGGMHVELSAR